MKIDKIKLDQNNRMIRTGFGKHDDNWFFRIDLWFIGYRFKKNKIMNRDTSWDDPQLSDGDFPSNQPKFKVGDKAVKVKGYKFPCTIVSVFQTVEGNTRVVGEMDEYGLLHIFNEDQLERAN